MIEPMLKLKVVERGTHILPVSEWNNDVPSPCECVAEALADVEYRIAELVRLGGNDESTLSKSEAARNLSCSIQNLNASLYDASKQNWKLELERNPNIIKHYPMDMQQPPVEHCQCEICEMWRAKGAVKA